MYRVSCGQQYWQKCQLGCSLRRHSLWVGTRNNADCAPTLCTFAHIVTRVSNLVVVEAQVSCNEPVNSRVNRRVFQGASTPTPAWPMPGRATAWAKISSSE